MSGTRWRKSTRSDDNGGNCIEVAHDLPSIVAYTTASTLLALRSTFSPRRLGYLHRNGSLGRMSPVQRCRAHLVDLLGALCHAQDQRLRPWAQTLLQVLSDVVALDLFRLFKQRPAVLARCYPRGLDRSVLAFRVARTGADSTHELLVRLGHVTTQWVTRHDAEVSPAPRQIFTSTCAMVVAAAHLSTPVIIHTHPARSPPTATARLLT
ncbi:DUF397 domain-containing protein [Micromonospora sp. NBC_01699]|uniref:DUF397 domain-containing protein n=1 Tax=Micromonospora sp. NBC_01699 TaxID=2975984 RepID=UPI002E2BD5D7|nr:DUF397 domain-containing protein [Micromonospora sp. NBC_01699]